MAFADNLRRLRVERFLSQRELARQAGLHAITLVRLEAGRAAPSTPRSDNPRRGGRTAASSREDGQSWRGRRVTFDGARYLTTACAHGDRRRRCGPIGISSSTFE
jgi:Helix-turn-helix domain